jgi:mannose-1-phosphate guanylyltransferase
MFAFHIGTLLEDGQKLCKDIAEPFLYNDPCEPLSIEQAYREIPSQSIDYAIMEKTDHAWVVPASFEWSDVGSWQSLFELSTRDDSGNVLRGKNIVIDNNNCLIYGAERLIVAVGMEVTAIIDTPDALMVCPLDQTQRVKEIVEEHTEASVQTL